MKEVYITFFYNSDSNIETVVSVFKNEKEAKSQIKFTKKYVRKNCKIYYKKAMISEDIYTK